MFKTTYNRGFQITFKNGNTISVQFGSVNYCERRNTNSKFGDELSETIISSNNAEVAIWNSENVWYKFGGDTVEGWVNADDVADWIYKAKNNLLEF